MQIKEIKIAGFQCETAKITLTYQVTENWSRYIIRYNRKIIKKYMPIEPWINRALVDFCVMVENNMIQTKLNI